MYLQCGMPPMHVIITSEIYRRDLLADLLTYVKFAFQLLKVW